MNVIVTEEGSNWNHISFDFWSYHFGLCHRQGIHQSIVSFPNLNAISHLYLSHSLWPIFFSLSPSLISLALLSVFSDLRPSLSLILLWFVSLSPSILGMQPRGAYGQFWSRKATTCRPVRLALITNPKAVWFSIFVLCSKSRVAIIFKVKV
jgi:hypothetical protein